MKILVDFAYFLSDSVQNILIFLVEVRMKTSKRMFSSFVALVTTAFLLFNLAFWWRLFRRHDSWFEKVLGFYWGEVS